MNVRGGTFLAKQRVRIPAHLLRESVGSPRLQPRVQRFRVMDGDEIIGQFSNMALVEESVLGRRTAKVFDVSMCPHRLLYQDGKWLLGMIQ